MDNSRFYSFVAGLYLSPLQCGLQTAHAVSEMYAGLVGTKFLAHSQFIDWATDDKTIIICNALNSKGVLDAHQQLSYFGTHFNLPVSLFCEDEDSLNNAATATAIVVPRKFYDVTLDPAYELVAGQPVGYCHQEFPGTWLTYAPGSQEFEFVSFLKSYRLV